MFIFLIRGHETRRPLMKDLVAGEPRAFPTSSEFLLRLKKKKRSPVNFMTAVSKSSIQNAVNILMKSGKKAICNGLRQSIKIACFSLVSH